MLKSKPRQIPRLQHIINVSLPLLGLLLGSMAITQVASAQQRIAPSIAEGQLVYHPYPKYPPLAKMASIQGVVLLNVTINEEGAIQDLGVMSGHPYLVKAAAGWRIHWFVCMRPTNHGQHLCHRVLSVACSGFLTVAQALLPVHYAWNASALDTGRSACATRETTYYSRAFSDDCQPWYAVKIPGVVGYKRAGVFDGSGRNPGILGGDRLPPPHAANLAPSRTQLPV